MGGMSLRIENSNTEALKSVKTCGYSCKATLPNCSFQHGCTRILELSARHKHGLDCKWMDAEGREIHGLSRKARG